MLLFLDTFIIFSKPAGTNQDATAPHEWNWWSYFSVHDVLKENLTWDDDDSALVAIDAAAMSALAM